MVVRILVFLLSIFLLGVVQTTLVSLIFPSYLRPDLMILLVTFLGISLPLLPGALLAFFCGLLYDTFSGGVFGLFAFVYLSIFFFLKLLAKFLILGKGLLFRIPLVALLMGFQALLLVFLAPAMGIVRNLPWPLPGWILPQILTTCAASWPLFYLFQRLDIPPAEEPSPSVP